MTGLESRSVGSLPMSRRRFLAAASAGAAAFAFGGAAGGQQAAPQGRVLPLSVGYLEDSDGLPSLRTEPWRSSDASALRVVPAAAMALGDQSLVQRVVEMTVHGLYPALPPRSQAWFSTVVLTVFFPSDDPLHPGPLPFYSWQAKLWPGPNVGQRLRFLVPVGRQGGLELVAEVFDGWPTAAGQRAARVLRGGGERQAPVSQPIELTSLYGDFTVDWYEGRPKLQRGFYFLGLAPDAWAGEWELPDARLGLKSQPLERTSIVVSIEKVEDDDPRLVAAQGH
jgi:hypothetical protein